MKNRGSGQALPIFLIFIIAVLLVGGIYYYQQQKIDNLQNQKNNERMMDDNNSKTNDAKENQTNTSTEDKGNTANNDDKKDVELSYLTYTESNFFSIKYPEEWNSKKVESQKIDGSGNNIYNFTNDKNKLAYTLTIKVYEGSAIITTDHLWKNLVNKGYVLYKNDTIAGKKAISYYSTDKTKLIYIIGYNNYSIQFVFFIDNINEQVRKDVLESFTLMK